MTWTRHHVTKRDTMYEPTITPDGPDPRHLTTRRTTQMNYTQGGSKLVTDNYKDKERAKAKTTGFWAGTTTFNELTVYPQVLIDDVTDQARLPRAASTPNEPTKQ